MTSLIERYIRCKENKLLPDKYINGIEIKLFEKYDLETIIDIVEYHKHADKWEIIITVLAVALLYTGLGIILGYSIGIA